MAENGTLEIRDAGIFQMGINQNNNKLYENSELMVSGTFRLINKGVFNQVSRLTLKDAGTQVSIQGSGTFEVAKLWFSTENQNQEIVNQSNLILIDAAEGSGTLSNLSDAQLFIHTDKLSNGTLNLQADASNNTVYFYGKNLIKPANATFHHLVIGGDQRVSSNNSSFESNDTLRISGNLTIKESARLSINNKNTTLKLSGNWIQKSSHNTPFQQGNGFVEFVGENDQLIKAETSAVIFNNLQLDKPSGSVILQSPVTLSQELKFLSGNLITDESNVFSFAAGSSHTGLSEQSFIDGPVIKTGNTAFIFPTGNQNKLGRIGISAPQNVGSSFKATYFADGHSEHFNSDVLVSNNEYWDLSRIIGTDSVEVILYWKDALSLLHNSEVDLVISHFDGTIWESIGKESIDYNVEGGSIRSKPVTTFSEFTFGSLAENSLLPIELLYFKAVPDAGKVTLDWVTSSEENNDFFTIERSIDLNNFEPIMIIPGSGNSNKLITYTEFDANPANGVNYYRLKQTDFDGRYSYSPIISVNVQYKANVHVYPSLWNGHEDLILKGMEGKALQARLISNSGQELTLTIASGSENDIIRFSAPSRMLPSGYYLLVINNGIHHYSTRIFKQ